MKICMKCYGITELIPVGLYITDKNLFLCKVCIPDITSVNAFNECRISFIRYKKLKELGI